MGVFIGKINFKIISATKLFRCKINATFIFCRDLKFCRIRFANYSAVRSLTKKNLIFGDRKAMNFRFFSAVILFFGKISVTTILSQNQI